MLSCTVTVKWFTSIIATSNLLYVKTADVINMTSVWRHSQNILTLCCLYLIFVYKSTDQNLMQTQMLINMTQPNHSRNKCKLIASFCVSLVACILNVVSLRSALKPPPHPPYLDPLPSVLFPLACPRSIPSPSPPKLLGIDCNWNTWKNSENYFVWCSLSYQIFRNNANFLLLALTIE